jgi:hypothetical protein
MHRQALLAVCLTLTLTGALPALAGDDNPECLGSSCGKPKEEGGGWWMRLWLWLLGLGGLHRRRQDVGVHR